MHLNSLVTSTFKMEKKFEKNNHQLVIDNTLKPHLYILMLLPFSHIRLAKLYCAIAFLGLCTSSLICLLFCVNIINVCVFFRRFYLATLLNPIRQGEQHAEVTHTLMKMLNAS